MAVGGPVYHLGEVITGVGDRYVLHDGLLYKMHGTYG